MNRLTRGALAALMLTLTACQAQPPAPVGLASLPPAGGRLLVKATGKLATVQAAVLAQGVAMAQSAGGVAAPSVVPSPELAQLGYIVLDAGGVAPYALENDLLAVRGVGSVQEDQRVRLIAPVAGGQASIRIALDPRVSGQWFHAKMGDMTAWTAGIMGAGITVAVIDTGVACAHPDLRCVNSGRDFTSSGSTADGYGHGTHVAGLATAKLNGLGGAGVAPLAVVLPVKVLDNNGSGYDSWIASGIVYASNQRAQVLNLSLGSDTPDQVLDDALKYATARGALVACAAGNDGGAKASYPNTYSGCIGVASGKKDTESGSTWSNYGVNADLVAPGEAMMSTCIPARWCQMSGTSMAAPVAAGVFALALGAGVPRAAVLGLVNRTGVPQTGRMAGLRRPNVAAMVAAIRASVTATATPTPRPTAARQGR